jgi:hypothetical protein
MLISGYASLLYVLMHAKSVLKICGKISWCGESCIDQMCRAIVRNVTKCVKKQGTFPQFHLLVLSFDLHVLKLDMGIC